MNRWGMVMALLAALGLAGCHGEPAVPPGQAAAPGPAAAPEQVAAPEPAATPGGEAVDPATLVKNGRMPLPGVLTGGQPTDEQLAALRDAGYRSVINLRPPDEPGAEGEAETVAGLGMAYVSIPVAGAAGLTEENAAALAAALEDGARPLLLHCASGNRVGALLALKAYWLDGASAEEALAAGQAGGVTRLEPAVREILGLGN